MIGVVGGLDLGGTKIEASLFDANLNCLRTRRIPTPQDDYDKLLVAICDQADWVRKENNQMVPLGIGCPGFSNDKTGIAYTANLPATGQSFRADLKALIPGLVIEQDLKCFALSEANGGAGTGCNNVFGLAFGTGLGGAYCIDGRLVKGWQGLVAEIGHVPIAAKTVLTYGLSLQPCGCGLTGCLETYVSGPGLAALALDVAGKKMMPLEIASAESDGDAKAAQIVNIWLDLAVQALLTVQLMLDPSCIVVGGGISHIEGIVDRMAFRFGTVCLPGSRIPDIKPARFGLSSGTRGAAMVAQYKG